MNAPLTAIQRYAKPSADFAAKLAETEALLRLAAATYAPVVQASSLGAEDMVVTHLIESLGLNIPVFVLDTGALHPDTLALMARTAERVPLTVYRPQADAVEAFVAREGAEAMYKSVALRQACCAIRKLEPLGRALQGHKAWITGLRREQSENRAEVPLIDESTTGEAGLCKFNPLAHWTWGDVWHCIATRGVDYHPLHDRFYPSVGCAPCTRAIGLGEPFRAGRWWWEEASAKECGLHLKTQEAA
jgi:phosphoadenosine phosphosulfate reductase